MLRNTVVNALKTPLSWIGLSSDRIHKKLKIKSEKPNEYKALLDVLQTRPIQNDKEAKMARSLIEPFQKQIEVQILNPAVDYNDISKKISGAIGLCEKLEAYYAEKGQGTDHIDVKLQRKKIHEMAVTIFAKLEKHDDIFEQRKAIAKIDQEGIKLANFLKKTSVPAGK